MSGCHDSDQKIKLIDLHKMVEDFERVHESLSIMDSRIKGHWELNYKAQENLSNRLEKIESNQLAQQLDPKVWVHVNDRLEKLESKIGVLDFNNWMAIIQDLEKKMQSKLDNMMEVFKCNWAADQSRKSVKPHKCPVCSTAGLVWDITSEEGLPWPNSEKIKCSSCHGKGIVWG